MHAKLLIPALAVLSLGSGGCYIGDFGDSMRYHRDFHYNFPISATGRVDVETFNGSVEITTWDQNTVDISGSKWGPTEGAADALRIDADHTPGPWPQSLREIVKAPDAADVEYRYGAWMGVFDPTEQLRELLGGRGQADDGRRHRSARYRGVSGRPFCCHRRTPGQTRAMLAKWV